MATHTLWHDEYWLLLMQLYLKRPQGVKPMYGKDVVNLALELHIAPEFLYRQLLKLRQIDTPSMQQLWDTYAHYPQKLKKEAKLVRGMKGFGNFKAFYSGVKLNETWETDFKPLDASKGDNSLSPVKLIMILDLYFRLVPHTMVPQTPEVRQLAKLIHSSPKEVSKVMEVFRFCDPLLSKEDLMLHPLVTPCMQVWQRFGNEDPQKLTALAAQLKDYWK